MSSGTKVVVLSEHPQVHEVFAEQMHDWHVQRPVSSVDDFWNGMQDESISRETQVIIAMDTFFTNPNNTQAQRDDFIALIATMAPHALVIVLSTDAGSEDIIKLKAKGYAEEKEIDRAPIEFVPYQAALTRSRDLVYGYLHREELEARLRAETEAENVHVESSMITSDGEKIPTDRNALVITSTSSKGGSGKSSVAMLLATQIKKSAEKAGKELRVCVVDLDIFDSQMGFAMGTMFPTALNIRLSKSILDAQLVHNNLIYNERMGIYALLAPIKGNTAHFTSPQFYKSVLDILRTMFDIVILDTSVQHFDDLIRSVALPEADIILVVTTLDIRAVKGMSRWIQNAITPRDKGGHGVPQNKLGIVVNGSLEDVNMDIDRLSAASLGLPMLVAIPLDTKSVQLAVNMNRLEQIIEHPHIGPAYFKLAKKVTFVRRGEIPLVPIVEETSGNKKISPQVPGGRPGSPAPLPEQGKKPGLSGLFRGRK